MRPGDDPTTRTRRAYDGAAEAFRDRTADRSRVEPLADAFAAQVAPGGLVLDLGCGPGHDRPLLERRGLRVVGMDLSSTMLALGACRGDRVDAGRVRVGRMSWLAGKSTLQSLRACELRQTARPGAFGARHSVPSRPATGAATVTPTGS